MNNSRRVVITGLGVLAPGGIGAQPFFDLVSQGRSGLGPVELYELDSFRLKTAGEVKDFEPKKFVENRKSLKVMARDIQLAMGAAKLATEDACLNEKKPDLTRFGVNLGAGLINTSVTELGPAVQESIGDNGEFDIRKYGSEGMRALTPLWLLKYLPNMLACHISILYDAQGPSNTLTTGCAASTQAIGEAFHIINRGDADVMIAGGAESKLDPLSWARFEMLNLLTQNGAAPEKAVRPFDAARDGFVNGEAAAIVILEELEHAKKRGVPIYGEITGFGSTANPSPVLKKVDARAQSYSMKMALNEAQVNLDEIDYIHAHGLGLKVTDKLETDAMKDCFGQQAYKIPASSTKGATGFIGTAAGALGVATTLLSMKNQVIPPTINCENPDPECDLDYVPLKAREKKVKTALVNTFGLVGQNGTLCIKAFE